MARRKGLALGLGLLAAAVVAGASFWGYLDLAALPGGAVAPESSGQGQGDDIAALLAQAQSDFAALRLTAPAGSNALEKYRKVLELAPDNAAARQGLQGIADRFVGMAQQALAAGDLDQAAEHLRQAEAILPLVPNVALPKIELALEKEARERESAASILAEYVNRPGVPRPSVPEERSVSVSAPPPLSMTSRVPSKPNISRRRKGVDAEKKQERAEAALRAADAALAGDDVPSVLARLEEAREAGAEPAVLDERRRRLRDRVEILATAAASEAKQALQKNDAAAARAAIQRARDLKAQAAALDAVRP